MEAKAEFAQLNNQQAVLQRLSSSYRHGRIGHAYIFDGEKGTGKTAVAKYYSKLLLCHQPIDAVPCETCLACRRVETSNHPNVLSIHPDGQDIKKEQMSNLIEQMSKTAYEAGRKVYIIQKAERLNVAAANTLLKFLEEPEGDITAILLTDSYHTILPTIQSRCQRIAFLPPQREQRIEQLIAQGLTNSMAATTTMITANNEIAIQLANDEQFAQMRKTVLKLVEVLERQVEEALLFVQTEWPKVFKEKDTVEQGLDLLLYVYRDIVALKVGQQSTLTYPDQQQLLQTLSIQSTYERLSTSLEAILQAKKYLHRNMNRTLLMEQLVLNMKERLVLV